MSRLAAAAAFFLLTLLFSAGARAAASPAATAEQPAAAEGLTPPATLDDVSAWLDFKARTHSRALPVEARLFYRRALVANRSGDAGAAMEFMRGAADLDPTFLEARWTLAGWLLLAEPGQALQQLAGAVEVVRQDFPAQWGLWANGAYLVVQAWLAALMALGFMVLFFRQPELRHAWKERLSRWMSPATAGVWSWVLLLVPFALGLGLALPSVALLAMLWPSLKRVERALFVALVVSLCALPLAAPEIGRLAAPMRDGDTPLESLLAVEVEPYSDARRDQFAELARSRPRDPYAQFGDGWMAQQAGDLAAAESAYRRALHHWPTNACVLNNLANVLALEGRSDDAVRAYQQAIQGDPADATAYFNLSQIYTHQYEFASATEALSKASALDFDLVRSLKEQRDTDGSLALVPQWLTSDALWRAVRAAPTAGEQPPVPPAWQGRIEFAGWPFTAAVLLLALAGLGAGRAMHRALPLLRCSNCDTVVCRRCSERRRWEALCSACARVAASAPSPEFMQMLLAREARRRERIRGTVHAVFAVLVPGLGLVAFRRIVRPFLLLFVLLVVAGVTLDALPYAVRPRIGVVPLNFLPLLLGVLIPVWALSVLGFFREQARSRALAARERRQVRPRRATVRLREPLPEAGSKAA